MIAEASAVAKIILCGEHAVVYNQPAIAVPVPSLRAIARAYAPRKQVRGLVVSAVDLNQEYILTDVEQYDSSNPILLAAQLFLARFGLPVPDVKVTLTSDIPVASGLGSGAAITTAFLRVLSLALNQPIAKEDLNDLVYEVEKVHHGTPSGVDNTVVVFERPIYFVRNQAIEWFALGTYYEFLIGDTGISASTQVAVGDVRVLYQTNFAQVNSVIYSIGEIVRQMRKTLEDGDIAELGRLMLQNHRFLQQLTVSSDKLDTLVEAALKAGAFGAKLSGGGRGGNMIALVNDENEARVKNALIDAGATKVYKVALG